jgi:16S rRNA G966 N2-methylase RsmD
MKPDEVDFKVDSEFVRLLTPLSEDEHRHLESSVIEHGCRDPLVVWDEENLLLDGHNRLGICRTHNKRLRVERISLPDRAAARLWIRLNQLGRRNSTPEAIAALRGGIYEDEKQSHGGQIPGSIPHYEGSIETAERLAENFDVSRATIERDAKFFRSLESLAERYGDEVRAKVLARDARVSRKDVVALAAIEDDDERDFCARELLNSTKRARLSDVQRQRRKSVSEAASSPASGQRHRMLLGDMAELCAEIDAGSIDAIVTDPPYPKEYVPLYGTLAKHAARILRPGGSCVVMCGQSYLPDIIALMTQHLTYHWMLAYLTPGGQAVQIWPRKVNTFWKPLLWFVNGKYDGSWIGDVCKSRTNDNDKRFHEWGQSESGMCDVIDRVTKPGELVLDPFAGASTTGVVCVRMGRRYVGIEQNEEQFHTSCQRLAAEDVHSTLNAQRCGQSALFGKAAE